MNQESWSELEKNRQGNNKFTLNNIFKFLQQQYEITLHHNAEEEFAELIKKNNSVKSQIEYSRSKYSRYE